MKYFLLLVLSILCVQQGIAQYTLIPDSNFEQALIDLNIDSEGTLDGQVLTNDINTITYLDVNDKNIEDLTGIEGFTSLITLFCWNNNLSFLDVTNNILLEELFCDNNNFTTPLDLSSNINLRLLTCAVANLSSLDVSNNLLLEILFCGNEIDILPFNIITELDLSNNINLRFLSVYDLFTLESLDLSNNPNLEGLDAGAAWELSVLSELNLANGNNETLIDVSTLYNYNLFCIEVDDEEAATNGDYPYSEWFINEEASFSEDCNLGVEDVLAKQITFYPNPVQNVLHIQSQVPIKNIEVYDVLCHLVLEQQNAVSQIDLSQLASGLLFIKLETDQGFLIKKVLKK